MERKLRLSQLLAGGLVIGALLAGARLDIASAGSPRQTRNSLVSHPSAAGLSGEILFAGLLEHNRLRESLLQSYSVARTYQLKKENGKVRAESQVAVQYRSPGTKEFAITSEKGSGFIRNHVFKPLFESEAETAAGRNHHDSSITPANYQFEMLGEEDAEGYHCYVVRAIPRRRDKYRFEGKIWIHATEMAIVKTEGYPAKNPSFWIKHVDFVRRYQKVGDFWLPLRDESVSDVRFFGKYVLTIDYNGYQVTGSERRSAGALKVSRKGD